MLFFMPIRVFPSMVRLSNETQRMCLCGKKWFYFESRFHGWATHNSIKWQKHVYKFVATDRLRYLRNVTTFVASPVGHKQIRGESSSHSCLLRLQIQIQAYMCICRYRYRCRSRSRMEMQMQKCRAPASAKLFT